MTKKGDTMQVVCNVFLKDISNFFKFKYSIRIC